MMPSDILAGELRPYLMRIACPEVLHDPESSQQAADRMLAEWRGCTDVIQRCDDYLAAIAAFHCAAEADRPTTGLIEAVDNALASLTVLMESLTCAMRTAEIKAVVGACWAMLDFCADDVLDIEHESYLRQFVGKLSDYFDRAGP